MAPKEKNVYKKYNLEDMKRALDDIHLKKLSVRAASKFYKVPFSTLLAKYQGKYPVDARPGPATILTSEEENALVEWILHMSVTGFCITKEQLLNSVQKLVKDLKRETPFTDGRPSKRWYQSFLNRHPQVSLKLAQNLSLRRAEVSEEDVRNWFREIKMYLESKNLLNISSSRVFNCDESAFLLNPKSKKVLASKNQKAAYIRITTDEKECLTVLITGNADGQLAPPMVLYAYERIPGPIAAAAPAGWSLGHSKSGWMTQESFYEYVTSVFYKWCLHNHLEFPIIIFVDGHRSHLTLALSNFCIQHKIELIALYPNATHLLQPMDVALFRPLKLNWNKVVATWRIEHGGVSVDKGNFAPLLNKAISMLDTKRILGNGFKACGLYPFSPDAVDYSRLLHSNKTDINTSTKNKKVEDKKSCIQFIEENIPPETLKCFKMNKTGIWTGEIRDENLFYLWLRATSKENHATQENTSLNNQEVIADGV